MYNVCLIGHGYWGEKLARNFHNSEMFNLISIVDKKQRNLYLAKKNYPFVKCFNNYKKAIQNFNLDLVIIASPTSTHFKIAEYALKNFTAAAVDTEQQYLRKTYFKSSNQILNSSTASFTAVTASAPATMTSTTEDDFVFFINGQYMEHDALTIEQSGSSFLLQVDTDSIGYSLESDDEIISIGKFNA